MKKLNLIWICMLLFIPIVFGGVTRTINEWNCPAESGANKGYIGVSLAQSGALTSYSVFEIFQDEWVLDSPSVGYLSTDLTGPTKKITFLGSKNDATMTYKIKIPAKPAGETATITGTYVIDTGSETPVAGSTIFFVRPNTCNPGESGKYGFYNGYDDRDADTGGQGCSCVYADCDDDPTNDISQTSYPVIDKSAHSLDNLYNFTSYASNMAFVKSGREDLGYCNGIDDDCGNNDCCPTYYRSRDTSSWYDAVSPLGVCNGLDNVEKTNFLNDWFNGLTNPTLQDLLSNLPTTYSNPP